MSDNSSNFIPLSVPVIRGKEWAYVKECLDTGWVSSAGKFVDRFETETCQYTGAKHAVACASGTAALHVALRIAGVTAGDEVIVPTVTFIASVNSIRYVDAQPVFMDCDAFYNLDAEKTRNFILHETAFTNGHTYNRHTNRRITALMPVHVFGNAVWLDELLPLCRERNIKVIEDAAESIGTRYTTGRFAGRHTGTIGDIGCLSFNGNKIITTGGGGMILTNDRADAERAKYLTTQAKDDEVRFVHNDVGYNYRLTNVQAAIGVAQLEQLPRYLEIKRTNYSAYKQTIDRIPGLHLAEGPAYASNNHWMYAMQIDRAIYGSDREQLMAKLAGHKIQTRPLWQLNHLQHPHANCQHYRIERAQHLLDVTLNLPCSVDLTPSQIERVVEVLRQKA
ncbi:MAG TPA: LegC family aminotransferase [Verrucomicrobiae bacterium]|nr:LegC family aminotransferase [Verrucomicrobiae bacterium]